MTARRYTLQPAGSRRYVAPGAVGPAPAAADDGTKAVNQHGKVSGQRNLYPSERRGPLDADQKARLCILAREAYERLHGRPPATADELTAWRRVQQLAAGGFVSLTHYSQRHYPALEAHFLDLVGESGRAFERLMAPEAGPLRQALAVLRRNLEQRGLPEAYAEAICRRQYKCTLGEASPRQLWRLVFTVRNRRRAPQR